MCLTWRGTYLADCGLIELARTDAERALSLRPSFEPALRLRKRLSAGGNNGGVFIESTPQLTDQEDSPDRLLSIAQHFMLRGDYMFALEAFDAFEEAGGQPSGPLYWRQRVVAKKSIGDFEGAAADLEVLLERWPDSEARALTELAGLREQLGQREVSERLRTAAELRAIAELESKIESITALIAEKEEAVLYYRRGLLHMKTGNNVLAIGDFTKAIQIMPNFVEAYQRRGRARIQLGDKTGGSEDLAYAKELSGSTP